MKFIPSVLVFTFIYALLSSCSTDEVNVAPVTESESLNNFLSEAPISFVNLNVAKVDTILVLSENFHNDSFVNESLFVGRPIKLLAFNEHIITIEFSSTNVVVSDTLGTPLQRIGRDGRGPGEFVRPTEIVTDGNFLYIYDDGLKRFSKFNADYRLIDSFDFTEMIGYQQITRMSNRFLVHLNYRASGIHAPNYEKLMNVREISNLDSVYFESMPRIVPSGMQPSAYNNAIFSINNDNKIVSAYPGLPYIFVYEDFIHTQTIVLESDAMRAISNPSLRPVAEADMDRGRVAGILRTLHLLPNGDILLSNSRALYHFRKTVNGDYELHRKYIFIKEDDGERITSLQSISTRPQNPNKLYIVGWQLWFSAEISF